MQRKIHKDTILLTILYTVLYIVLVVTWLGGIVIAKGGWPTAHAIINPFYAWYLLIERIMTVTNLI